MGAALAYTGKHVFMACSQQAHQVLLSSLCEPTCDKGSSSTGINLYIGAPIRICLGVHSSQIPKMSLRRLQALNFVLPHSLQ